MTATIDAKLVPVSGLLSFPIVQGDNGFGVDLGQIVINANQVGLPLKPGEHHVLGLFYDLLPDPKKFDPSKTNNNPGRYNLNVSFIYMDGRLGIAIDSGQEAKLKDFSEFLEERRKSEQELQNSQKAYLQAILYIQR